jgi:hypothetical protein
LDPICTALKRNREKEIRRLAGHNTQMNCELSSYQHSQFLIDQIIKRNTDFKDSEPYLRLKADLEEFFTRFASESESNETISTTSIVSAS